MNDFTEAIYKPEFVSISIKNYISTGHKIDISCIGDITTDIIKLINSNRIHKYDTTELHISNLLSIPYEILDSNDLEKLLTFVQNPEIIQHSNKTGDIMGASLILCAFLIVLNEIYDEKSLNVYCIFDVVLQTVLRDCRVNTIQILTDCIEYGYCEKYESITTPISKKQRVV